MAHEEGHAHGKDARTLDRMLFFSDAVFAIVLTIMVLELHLPVFGAADNAQFQGDAAVWHAVALLGHTIFAFVVSFALVGMWWFVHVRLTRTLIAFDWYVAVCNFLFLFTVALVPFATSVLSDYGATGAAWELYWGINAAISFSLTLLGLVVTRGGGRLVGGLPPRRKYALWMRNIASGVVFVIGIWLAASGHVVLSRYCWVLILPFMWAARLVDREPKKAPHETAP